MLLHSKGIQCIRNEYLADYLAKDTDITAYFVPEYKALLAQPPPSHKRCKQNYH